MYLLVQYYLFVLSCTVFIHLLFLVCCYLFISYQLIRLGQTWLEHSNAFLLFHCSASIMTNQLVFNILAIALSLQLYFSADNFQKHVKEALDYFHQEVRLIFVSVWLLTPCQPWNGCMVGYKCTNCRPISFTSWGAHCTQYMFQCECAHAACNTAMTMRNWDLRHCGRAYQIFGIICMYVAAP